MTHSHRGPPLFVIAFSLSIANTPIPAESEEALIAVATNFAATAEMLAAEFESSHEHEIIVVPGSTGRLFAQILNGAPFHAFLSADAEHPIRLENQNRAVPGSRFTYALGRLALWSGSGLPEVERQRDAEGLPVSGRIAIPDPQLAPYGRAALVAIEKLGIVAEADQVVYGESVGQTYSFVATGNAEIGFVALSYLLNPRHDDGGNYWIVPEQLHPPIVQDAVLVTHRDENAAAEEFLNFLRSGTGKEIISGFGYGVPVSDD